MNGSKLNKENAILNEAIDKINSASSAELNEITATIEKYGKKSIKPDIASSKNNSTQSRKLQTWTRQAKIIKRPNSI